MRQFKSFYDEFVFQIRFSRNIDQKRRILRILLQVMEDEGLFKPGILTNPSNFGPLGLSIICDETQYTGPSPAVMEMLTDHPIEHFVPSDPDYDEQPLDVSPAAFHKKDL